MSSKKDFVLGGQAVLEGVMMRSPFYYAVAVRRKTGEITVKSGPAGSILRRYRWLNIPFLRGIFALVEMMVLGIKTLRFSTDIALLDEQSEKARDAPDGSPPPRTADMGKVSFWIICCSLVFALLFKYTVFFAVPNVLVGVTIGSEGPEWRKHLIEGCVRVGFFIVFLSILSLSKELRRIFEYHGAEHKVVHTVEAFQELTVANARTQSRIHRRCGTTFLFLVLVVGIFVFAMFGWGSWKYNLMIRFISLPIVAGVAYEIIRLTRVKWAEPFARVLITPGLIFQYLTTREPDDSQLEVAIEAMKYVLCLEPEVVPEPEVVRSPAIPVPAAAAVSVAH